MKQIDLNYNAIIYLFSALRNFVLGLNLEDFGEYNGMVRLVLDKDTPNECITLEVLCGHKWYSFYVDQHDFDDVSILCKYCVDYITKELNTGVGKNETEVYPK